MSTAIKVENLSKAYQLGDFGTGTISRDLERFWARLRGKEDPFLRIGEVNDRTTKGTSDIVWSLRDINFDIEQGDAVGIIGRNGAGKSTLLKILSRVTAPTTGSVKIKGRIASLLEVGTGFHPELTGRENIYLNGAILGMRRAEIKRKFDEIVDFSGVERYIDTPVKRYSSGMYVRLAFAVAAHLESEILVIDEVLAVGDAEFQKKCLGKIGDVSKGEGRTVLFVSHNLGAVQNLCGKGVLLREGEIQLFENIQTVVDKYVKDAINDETHISNMVFAGPISHNFKFTEVSLNNLIVGVHKLVLNPEDAININVNYSIITNMPYRLTISIFKDGVRLFTANDLADLSSVLDIQNITSMFIFPAYILRPGIYQIALGGHTDEMANDWFWNENIGSFEIMKKWGNHLESINHGLFNIEAKTMRF